jgi:predicted transcriptional regulator
MDNLEFKKMINNKESNFYKSLDDIAFEGQCERIEKLEKENRQLSMNLSTLQGNMDAVMTILKDLCKREWEK